VQTEHRIAALARAAGAVRTAHLPGLQRHDLQLFDIDRESTRLARGLLDLGIRKGDAVASILDNNLEAVLCWFAINKAGAISVPVNTAYKGEFCGTS